MNYNSVYCSFIINSWCLKIFHYTPPIIHSIASLKIAELWKETNKSIFNTNGRKDTLSQNSFKLREGSRDYSLESKINLSAFPNSTLEIKNKTSIHLNTRIAASQLKTQIHTSNTVKNAKDAFSNNNCKSSSFGKLSLDLMSCPQYLFVYNSSIFLWL